MPPIPHHNRAALSGFECLVLLAVVATLLALLFPTMCGGTRENPRRQAAATCVKSAVNALKNYREDYGAFPALGHPRNAQEKFILVGDRAAGCNQSNSALFDVLRAIPRGPNANHAINDKQVKYLEGMKAIDASNPRDGFADDAAFPPEKQGRYYDPWGAEYCFVFETDDDGKINVGSIYRDLSAIENTLAYPAVGFSLGKDGELGGKGYEGCYKKAKSNEAPDDVVSWQ